MTHAANVVHDVGHGAVAVDDAGDAGEFHLWSFHDEESNEMEKRSKKLTAENELDPRTQKLERMPAKNTRNAHSASKLRRIRDRQ